jgi:glycine/D-amino acid oxidase-like deaminating enzyme
MRVLVVGAGVIGVAVADALAAGGAEVTVIEMRSPGRGASQASAGVLAPYTEAHGKTTLLELCARSLDQFDQFLSTVRERSGRAVEYSRTGTIEVALTAAEAIPLQAAHAWLNNAGIASEWMDAAQLRSFEPSVSPSAVGGLLIGAHGFVQVSALVAALVQSARFGGATFESPVEAGRHRSPENTRGRSCRRAQLSGRPCCGRRRQLVTARPRRRPAGAARAADPRTAPSSQVGGHAAGANRLGFALLHGAVD